MFADKKFAATVLKAANECDHPSEEEGGLIFEKAGDYCFVKIQNIHQGTSTAISLYEAQRNDMGRTIFEHVNKGWILFGSFHTHPLFDPYPSGIDIGTLFQGFPYNVIYSPKHGGLFSLTDWENDKLRLNQFITKEKLNELQ